MATARGDRWSAGAFTGMSERACTTISGICPRKNGGRNGDEEMAAVYDGDTGPACEALSSALATHKTIPWENIKHTWTHVAASWNGNEATVTGFYSARAE